MGLETGEEDALSNNLIGYLIQLVLALGTMLLVYVLIRTSLGELFDEVLKLAAGTKFYLRSLLLILLFGALAKAVGHKFDLKADAALMEYVWEVAGAFGEVLENAFMLFVLYLIQVTVLVAVLRRKHEQ